MKSKQAWRTLILTMSLLPSLAFSLAGFAERNSFFYYNDFALIERGHPSDLCWGPDKWCLVVRKDEFKSFTDLDFNFKQVSVPTDSANPYFVGQRSKDDSWLVYNFAEEKTLIAGVDYHSAIDVWISLGLVQPMYANARNTRKLLVETEESVSLRWSIDLQLWFFMGVVPFTPVVLIFWYLSRKSKQRYKEADSKIFGIFSYVFIVPVVFVLYLTITSFIGIIQQNW